MKSARFFFCRGRRRYLRFGSFSVFVRFSIGQAGAQESALLAAATSICRNSFRIVLCPPRRETRPATMRTQRLHLGGYHVRAVPSRLLYLPLLSSLSLFPHRASRDPSKVSSPSLKLYNPIGDETEPRAKNPCRWSLLTGVVKHSVYRTVVNYFYILFNDSFTFIYFFMLLRSLKCYTFFLDLRFCCLLFSIKCY